MGRRIAADYEVTAYEPDRHFAFKAIAGPVRPTGDFRFEQSGPGTKLTFALNAEVSGWKRIVMGRAVQQTMTAEATTVAQPTRLTLGAQLQRRQPEVHDRAVPGDAKVDPAPHQPAVEQALEVSHPFDGVAVELDDEVAGTHACGRGGSAVDELHDFEGLRPTGGLGQPRRQRAGAADHPDEGPPNAALPDQGGQDAAGRGVDRDGQAEADSRRPRC